MADNLGIQKIPAGTAIIGKIPGYNRKIDVTGKFQQELIKGITMVDLRPMTYQFLTNTELNVDATIETAAAVTPTAISQSIQAASIDGVGEFLKDAGKLLSVNSLFTRQAATSKKVFHGVLKRMQDKFDLGEDFSKTDMIRILGANDSTFTETFSNNFSGQNAIKTMWGSDKGSSKTGSKIIDAGFNLYRGAKAVTKSFASINHSTMIAAIGGLAATGTNAGVNSTVSDLMTGAIAGLEIATPSVWQDSSYSSTLSIFIKLVAPTGTDECIKENILKPMLYLLAAGSPLTYSGSTYGYPLLWDVQAHGITNFRVGGIAAMTLIRGSFETSFNHNLQPTVIDVRLTLVPLMNDFAVQTDPNFESSITRTDVAPNIYDQPDGLGVQNPGDLVRGITNREVKGTKSAYAREPLEITTIKL